MAKKPGIFNDETNDESDVAFIETLANEIDKGSVNIFGNSNDNNESKNDNNPLNSLDEQKIDDAMLTFKTEYSEIEYTLDYKSAMVSQLVKAITHGDKNARQFIIPKVDVISLGIIIDYLKFHKGNADFVVNAPIKDVSDTKGFILNEYDIKLFNDLSVDDVFSVLLGADYMDIRSLCDICCAKIACIIMVTKMDDIKVLLNDDNIEGERYKSISEMTNIKTNIPGEQNDPHNYNV
mmetsp:Transcript_77280/g.94762  ORF Transcript_77280/g.94762 Transcript_77280/m.94762 type:complete len:236 (+) Transcript_77280:28-735(+)